MVWMALTGEEPRKRPAKVCVYVISLRSRSDRRAHMAEVIARTGLDAAFIDAVDGRNLTPAQVALYDARKARQVYGAEMSPAEIGCCLSHLEAYRRMLADGADLALVLEDDVDCDPDLAVLVRQAAARRPEDGWKVLRLQSAKGRVQDASRADARGVAVSRIGGRTISRLRTGVVGACGYLITREGAQAMLAYAARPFMPIDQMMDRYWENGIEPYVLRPFPVRQNPGIASVIGSRKTAASQAQASRWLRRSRRAYDGVAKRGYQLRQSARRSLTALVAALPGWTQPAAGAPGLTVGRPHAAPEASLG